MKRYESDAVPQEASDTLMFFDGRPDAWKLYQAFEEELYSLFPTVNKRVQKTQITFSNPRVFVCVYLCVSAVC